MDWFPGEWAAPEYPDVPLISIVDSVELTLGPWKKKRWVRARNLALEKWVDSGLHFATIVAPPPNPQYPWNTGAITLSVQDVATSYDAGAVGGYAPTPRAGYAIFAPPIRLRRDQLGATSAMVAHEVGHALGFGHGGDGIMAGAWRASYEEIQALRDYYLGVD